MTTEMIKRTKFIWTAVAWGFVLFPVLSACSASSGSSPQGASAISPTRESIQRDFVNVSCLRCHTQETVKNRYVDLTDIMNLTQPGDHNTEAGHHHRVLIVPGCPKQSLFLGILKEGKMPPGGAETIPVSTLQALETWIVSLKPDAGKSCNSDEPQDNQPGPDEP